MNDMHLTDFIELEVQSLASDGRAVAKTPDGMAVFVQGALPGQRVLARVLRKKKNFAEAQVHAVLQSSPRERPAPCPHAGLCGGCPWQKLPYGDQLSWKKDILWQALRRIGRLGISKEDIADPLFPAADGAPLEWGCRNKMEFCFAPGEDGGTVLGLRQRASHKAADIRSCLLQTPRTMRVLSELRRLCAEHGLGAAPQGISGRAAPSRGILRFAVIREPGSGQCLAELITLPSPAHEKALEDIGKALLASGCGATGFVHSVRAEGASVAYGTPRFSCGNTILEETLAVDGRDLTLRLGHASFFQVNSRGAEILYNAAASAAKAMFGTDGRWGGQCWDIYCGAGGLALSLAQHFSSVRGMEISREAVELARQNALSNFPHGPDFHFEAGDAALLERFFARFGCPDLLVTDPPRAGMDSRVTQAILRHLPSKLLLISCDPGSLARDLGLLSSAYRICSIQPVDLFPQTPHIETVAALTTH